MVGRVSPLHGGGPSRPRALAAWGIQQDIFASGLAREAPEAEDAEAARARAGEVVERGLAVDIGKAGPRAARPLAPKGPTAAEQRRVQSLGDELEALERAYADSVEALRAEQGRLKTQAAEDKARFDRSRARLTRDLARARQKL